MCVTITKYLVKYNNAGNILAIFSDSYDRDQFLAGFVSDVSEEHVLINHVTPIGRYDGYAICRISDIFRVNTGGIYEKKLELLYAAQKKTHPKEGVIKQVAPTTSLFDALLLYAKENKLIVGIETSDKLGREIIVGFVKRIVHDSVIVNRLNTFGFQEGECIISALDVERLFCDKEEDRILGMLNKDNLRL